MFTNFDKAWIAPAVVFLGEGILRAATDADVTPVAYLSDPNNYIMAIATAALVYFVPNKGTTYE